MIKKNSKLQISEYKDEDIDINLKELVKWNDSLESSLASLRQDKCQYFVSVLCIWVFFLFWTETKFSHPIIFSLEKIEIYGCLLLWYPFIKEGEEGLQSDGITVFLDL